MGSQLAAERRDVPCVQRDWPLRHFALMAGDILRRLRLDAQLLAQLANQRVGLRFARLDFTAGKFPHSGLIGVGWALRQQNFAVLFKDRGDNIESFQHGHQ
ncbi:hypothetical protein D3C80_1117550 [compost metagenome]